MVGHYKHWLIQNHTFIGKTIVESAAFIFKRKFMDCIFCKIANKELPAKLVYEDANIVAFNDLNPQAPIHQLIIPRKHIATLNDVETSDAMLAGQLLLVAQQLAKQQDIAEAGYRVVMNCNKGAGQAVFHIHLHLLGGRLLTWPPG
jgi:histidine triad (HIT) family protein